jgi:hypothetical protein
MRAKTAAKLLQAVAALRQSAASSPAGERYHACAPPGSGATGVGEGWSPPVGGGTTTGLEPLDPPPQPAKETAARARHKSLDARTMADDKTPSQEFESRDYARAWVGSNVEDAASAASCGNAV